jgi:hypothetical protein
MRDVDWGQFYLLALSWGLQPSEFWKMSPSEWWLIYDSKRPRDAELDYAGSLNDALLADLYDMLEN